MQLLFVNPEKSTLKYIMLWYDVNNMSVLLACMSDLYNDNVRILPQQTVIYGKVTIMGLFNLFKGNRALNAKSEKSIETKDVSKETAIHTIAAVISENDGTVLEKVTACLSDSQAYFNKYAFAFSERGIDSFDEMPLREFHRIAMVDALFEGQYVCEQDWKSELDDFLYFLRELKCIKAWELPLEESWFDSDSDIGKWCAIINEKWKKSNICLAGIDMESDAYVLFPCRLDKLNTLRDLAKTVSCRIDYAERL